MNKLLCLLAVMIAAYISIPAFALASSSGNETLLVQFITDDGDVTGKDTGSKQTTVDELRRRELAKKKLIPIIGASGGMNYVEGFARVFAIIPVGMQIDRFTITAEPIFIFQKADSLQIKNEGLRALIRSKASGQIMEIGIPFKFTYSILDIGMYPYTPYFTAGCGYNHRRYAFSGSSIVSRISKDYFLDSLTLNYGFGFLVRVTGDTRFQVGITAVSYFNKRTGPFNYETTGGSVLLGMMVILE